MTTSQSIIEELIHEHGINSIGVPCQCTRVLNNTTGYAKKNCAYCLGHGKIQYGIDEVTFFQ